MMPALSVSPSSKRIFSAFSFLAIVVASLFFVFTSSAQIRGAMGPAPQTQSDQSNDAASAATQTPAAAPEPEAEEEPEAKAVYDPEIFQTMIPADQLATLKKYEGMASGDVMRDKAFRKISHDFVPDCIYHYGSDMSLPDALDKVIDGSPERARIRDGRYFVISGKMGPYLGGRGFLWIDTQTGFGLGGFYFHPTNGEPTP